MSPDSPFYHQRPLNPAPVSMQTILNCLFLGLFAVVLAFESITYFELMTLRESVQKMQLNASR